MQAIDDRCRPYRQARRNLAARHAGGRQPQHVTDVAHRQSRSWHWPPPSPVEKGVRPLGFADNPMVLRPHTSQRSTSLLGLARFSCSGSLGMAARDQSEQMLGINRNRCSGSPGAPIWYESGKLQANSYFTSGIANSIAPTLDNGLASGPEKVNLGQFQIRVGTEVIGNYAGSTT